MDGDKSSNPRIEKKTLSFPWENTYMKEIEQQQ
jgi:hypothetical protein